MRPQSAPNIKALYGELVKDLQTYIMFRIKQRMNELTPELELKNRAPINLSIGAPVQPPPQVVIEALCQAFSDPTVSTYSSSKGEPFFLQAVADRMAKRFGISIDPKTEACCLIGSKEGLANLFRAFTTPSLNKEAQDIFVIPDPGYAAYKEAIETSGALAYPMQLRAEDNYLPDPYQVLDQLARDGLDPAKTKMLLINYPSNPIGARASREYLQSIVDFGIQNNILICSDAAYADLAFGQSAEPSILECAGAKKIAIELHSLSKPYSMTGWRIGYAVGNADAIDILVKVKSTADSGVFKGIQRAGQVALTDPACDEYIQKTNQAFARKQKLMIQGFQKLGWPIKEESIPKATFYLWLPIPARYTDSEQFTNELMEKSGIIAVPGSGFGIYGEGYFRLSLVLEDEKLAEAIQRMEQDGFYYE